jgi:putative exosortase-associated protein (TIGR04073 family)
MTRTRTRSFGSIALLTVALVFTIATAAVVAIPSTAHAVEYTPARKMGRGLAAMTCGFLEVPGNVVEMTRERSLGWGLSLGFVQGLGMIVVRELVGVYEFVSAPLELPPGYVPIIRPEFPWGYFDEQTE